jgi:hypothetical protein
MRVAVRALLDGKSLGRKRVNLIVIRKDPPRYLRSKPPMSSWKRETEEPGPPTHGPDFSTIDSREKALTLVERGELEPLYLMPPEFGGPEAPINIVYVPIGIADVKRGIDLNIIAPLVESGDVQNYSAVPEYRGRSFIPMSIRINASDPKRFESEINIWGEALDREAELSG